MKFGDLIKQTVQMTGHKATAVRQSLRLLREAGHITSTGGRGPGAPDLHPRDVAALLITYLAYEVPGTRGAEAVARFGSMVCAESMDPLPLSLEGLRGLHPPFTFLEALAGLVAIYAFDRESDAYRQGLTELRDGTFLPPEAHVSLHHDQTGARAEIHINRRRESGAGYHFATPLLSVAEARRLPDPRFDPLLTRSAEIREGTILHFARHLKPPKVKP